MSWFRLEGRGAFHHKVVAAGDEAYGAWCRAGQWSSDQLTDGFVPESIAKQINRKQKIWDRLVLVVLAHKVDGGYQIHDYLDFNPCSEQERARREETRGKRREAGRAGGKRSGEVRREQADAKQLESKPEATPKQIASTIASSGAKQNEAPSPYPIPREEQKSHTQARARAGDLGNGVTAEGLLQSVSRYSTLLLLHRDLDWAHEMAALAASKLCRAEDADAAVEAFMFKHAGATWHDAAALRKALGGYMAKAKEHGDAARAAPRAGQNGAHRISPSRPDPSRPAFAPLAADDKPWTPEDS